MRILITGGTGLIGRQLCIALLHQGQALTVLSRRPEQVSNSCGAQVRAWKNLSEWKPHFSFDAIINLAGEPIADKRWTKKQKQALWESRVSLTRDLVSCITAASQKPSVILSGSAIGYYGNRGDLMLPESESPGTDFAAELTLEWEHAAKEAQSLGIRVCNLRTGLVLSREGGLLNRFMLPFKMGLGFRIGNGRQWMSWIHMADYVDIVLRMLHDQTMNGPYNLTAPNPVCNTDFAKTLATLLQRPALFTAPSFLLKFMLGERSSLLLGGQRVIPAKLLNINFQFKYPVLEEALNQLLTTQS